MDYKGIIGSLSQNLTDYELPVTITKGYDFNQKDNINKLELYRASRFESGEYDTANTTSVYIKGYTNPNDGGGGIFNYDASLIATSRIRLGKLLGTAVYSRIIFFLTNSYLLTNNPTFPFSML